MKVNFKTLVLLGVGLLAVVGYFRYQVEKDPAYRAAKIFLETNSKLAFIVGENVEAKIPLFPRISQKGNMAHYWLSVSGRNSQRNVEVVVNYINDNWVVGSAKLNQPGDVVVDLMTP